MNRIEIVREYINSILVNTPDYIAKRCGYFHHLYGVSQACAMIAIKRNENAELATIAGMLHDIHSYLTLDSTDHAYKGSIVAREILTLLHIFEEDEITLISNAICNHSNKETQHSSFDEVLIDADVLQHCLYNPLLGAAEHEKERFKSLKLEFGIM